MGAMDKIHEMKDKAKEAMSGGKMDDKIDKAADKADEKTGGKHSDQIDKGAEQIKKMGDQQ